MEEETWLLHELNEDDKIHIADIFFEEITAKLKKLDARIGAINCSFAGKKYKNWNIHFRSVGPDFEIVEFEYDEDGSDFSLDL